MMNKRIKLIINHVSTARIVLLSLVSLLFGCVQKEPEILIIEPEFVIASEASPFENVDSVAVTENAVYVSDISAVKVFDRSGKFIKSIGEEGSEPGQFDTEVIGVAVNNKNELLAVDMDNHRVQVFTLDGEFIRSFGEHGEGDGQFMQPQGIAVDRYDIVYVSDKHRSDIQVFSPKGEFLYTISQKGRDRKDLFEAESMTIKDEKLYIADEGNHRIQVFDLRGKHIRHLPDVGKLVTLRQEASMDDIMFESDAYKRYDRTIEGDIEGIAFDNKDNLYFVDEDHGTIGVIYKSNLIATFQPSEAISSPDGLALSPDYKTLFVCDQGNNRVLAFNLGKMQKMLVN